jgi:hypothetical protein
MEKLGFNVDNVLQRPRKLLRQAKSPATAAA